jgi:multimeric flavodoxin WrbA
MALKAVAFNVTLKSNGGDPSSTNRLIELIADSMRLQGVATETIRLADHNIKPGVASDEGDGDAWPDIRKSVLAADILIFGTPIWMGQPSSVAKRAPERMDAFLSEPMTRDEWYPMAASPRSRWSETKMVPITSLPKSIKR